MSTFTIALLTFREASRRKILLAALLLGLVFLIVTKMLGVEKASFPFALAGKFLTVFLSVWMGCRLATGWTGRRFNDAVALKMAEMSKTKPK